MEKGGRGGGGEKGNYSGAVEVVTNRVPSVPFSTMCYSKMTVVTNHVLSVPFSTICHSRMTVLTNRADRTYNLTCVCVCVNDKLCRNDKSCRSKGSQVVRPVSRFLLCTSLCSSEKTKPWNRNGTYALRILHVIIAVSLLCKAIFWPTPGFKERTFDGSRISADGPLTFKLQFKISPARRTP